MLNDELIQAIAIILGVLISGYFMITFVYLRIGQMPPLPWGLY